jgi:hypothetical protein
MLNDPDHLQRDKGDPDLLQCRASGPLDPAILKKLQLGLICKTVARFFSDENK